MILQFMGPIGVGKTTIAKTIAKKLSVPFKKEPFEQNIYLKEWYKTQDLSLSFKIQLQFLIDEFNILDSFRKNMHKLTGVVDFGLSSGIVFAQQNLSEIDFKLYDKIFSQYLYSKISNEIYTETILLTADVEVLMERIKKRARDMEKDITSDYINNLQEGYLNLFKYSSWINIVDTTNLTQTEVINKCLTIIKQERWNE